jgi:hypothetical protein
MMLTRSAKVALAAVGGIALLAAATTIWTKEVIAVVLVSALAVAVASPLALLFMLLRTAWIRVRSGHIRPLADLSRIRWLTRAGALMWGLVILPAIYWAVWAMVGLAPDGAFQSWATMALAGGFWLLPLLCLVALIGGLVCSRASANRATTVAGFGFVWLPSVDVAFILMMVAAFVEM